MNSSLIILFFSVNSVGFALVLRLMRGNTYRIMVYNLFVTLMACLYLSAGGMQEKEYIRSYYEDGTIATEGWLFQHQKTDYWFEYHPNGTIASKGHFKNDEKDGYWFFYTSDGKLYKEGHFVNNKAENWWIIYDIAALNKKTQITRKLQYQNNKKNGYCLLYKNGTLFKAEKYNNDQKTGEWTDVLSFKRDNPNASL